MLRVPRVRSEENVADLGTKPLGKAAIAKHCLTLEYVNMAQQRPAQGVAMIWDFRSILMFVTILRVVSTQNAPGDHVTESSHRDSSRGSSNSSSSSGDEQLQSLAQLSSQRIRDGMASFTEEISVLTRTVEETTIRQGNVTVEDEKLKHQFPVVPSWPLWSRLSSGMAVAPPRRQSGNIFKGSCVTPSS